MRDRARAAGSRRRGLALLLVLGVVAVASVLSWAMLSASAMRAKVESTTADALDAGYLAESGASYALYYARYPERSPVPITPGANGAWSAAQSNVQLWSDARAGVDVSVNAAEDGTFAINSASTVNGIRRSLVVNAAYTYDRYTVTHAAGFNGDFYVPTNFSVNGPTSSRGTVTGFYATNFNQGRPAATGNWVVPVYSDLTLIQETGTAWPAGSPGAATDRVYTYDGKKYHAERLPSLLIKDTTLRTSNPALNPMNVWYAEDDVVMTNSTLPGTLVLRGPRKLTINATCTITTKGSDIPALICDRIDMYVGATPARLTIDGVAWLNTGVVNSGILSTSGFLKVNGALLFGGTSPQIALAMKAPITVSYNASVKKIPAMGMTRSVNGLVVQSWKQGT